MTVNQQQTEHWNGGESVHYVDHAERYDRQLAPFTTALLGAARLRPTDVVLDIGCGCGATTLAAAREAGRAVGADLSVPLLEIASDRAAAGSIDNAEFVVADAQTQEFGEGAFDAVISQFGVMFFDDPPAAFSNLRRSLTPGGRIAFICWQALTANEWLTVVADQVARRVALPRFGGLTGGPGMFALSEPDETSDLLGAAGFTGLACEPLTPEILIGGGGTLDESLEFLLGMGMVRGLLGLAPADTRDAVITEVRSSLAERFEPGTGVRLGSGAWLVSGTAGSMR